MLWSRGEVFMRKFALAGWIALVALGSVSTCLADEPSVFAKQFEYDRDTPLNIQQIGTKQQSGVTVRDITYEGANGGRVPAYLVEPAEKGRFAGILWGHWMMPGSSFMNRTEFLEEAVALARSGVVSLLIDSPMVRLGSKQQVDSESYEGYFRQDVIDLRRGIDLLLSRNDVDPHRVGYVGHSFHAATGGVLAGVDSRIKVFALMAGGMDSSRVLVSGSKYAVEMRQKIGEAALKQFLEATPWMNPAKYLGSGQHAPLLLQFGTHDAFMTRDDCEEYASVVSPPKQVKF